MKKAHPLLRYCQRMEITQQEFADRAGISQAMVSYIISGQKMPGRASAMKIVGASLGDISLEQLFLWETKTKDNGKVEPSRDNSNARAARSGGTRGLGSNPNRSPKGRSGVRRRTTSVDK